MRSKSIPPLMKMCLISLEDRQAREMELARDWGFTPEAYLSAYSQPFSDKNVPRQVHFQSVDLRHTATSFLWSRSIRRRVGIIVNWPSLAIFGKSIVEIEQNRELIPGLFCCGVQLGKCDVKGHHRSDSSRDTELDRQRKSI